MLMASLTRRTKNISKEFTYSFSLRLICVWHERLRKPFTGTLLIPSLGCAVHPVLQAAAVVLWTFTAELVTMMAFLFIIAVSQTTFWSQDSKWKSPILLITPRYSKNLWICNQATLVFTALSNLYYRTNPDPICTEHQTDSTNRQC